MILVGFSKTVTIAIHDKYACKKKYIYELAKEQILWISVMRDR